MVDWFAQPYEDPDAELTILYGSDTVLGAGKQRSPIYLWNILAMWVFAPGKCYDKVTGKPSEPHSDYRGAYWPGWLPGLSKLPRFEILRCAGDVLRIILYQTALKFSEYEWKDHSGNVGDKHIWCQSYNKELFVSPPWTNVAQLVDAFMQSAGSNVTKWYCSVDVAPPYLMLPEFENPWRFWGLAPERGPCWIPVSLCATHWEPPFPAESWAPSCDSRLARDENELQVRLPSVRYYPLLVKGKHAKNLCALYNYFLALAFEHPLTDVGSPSDILPPYTDDKVGTDLAENLRQLVQVHGTVVHTISPCCPGVNKCADDSHCLEDQICVGQQCWTPPLCSLQYCKGAYSAGTAGEQFRAQANCANEILASLVDTVAPKETNFFARRDEVVMSAGKCPDGWKLRYGPTPDKPGARFTYSNPYGGPFMSEAYFDERLAELNEDPDFQDDGGPWDGWIMVKFYVEKKGKEKHNGNRTIVFRGPGTRDCCLTLNQLMDWTSSMAATSWDTPINDAGTSITLWNFYYEWFKAKAKKVECQPPLAVLRIGREPAGCPGCRYVELQGDGMPGVVGADAGGDLTAPVLVAEPGPPEPSTAEGRE